MLGCEKQAKVFLSAIILLSFDDFSFLVHTASDERKVCHKIFNEHTLMVGRSFSGIQEVTCRLCRDVHLLIYDLNESNYFQKSQNQI